MSSLPLPEVFSFQMLLDSATKHERARCARAWEEEGLDKKGVLVG